MPDIKPLALLNVRLRESSDGLIKYVSPPYPPFVPITGWKGGVICAYSDSTLLGELTVIKIGGGNTCNVIVAVTKEGILSPTVIK